MSSNHWTVAVISHANKLVLKTLHARLQHYTNQELPDVQAGFKKGRGGRSQDGGGIGRGDHFLFYKFIERTTER